MPPKNAEYVLFQAGDILFEEHEESYHFLVIQEGQVEIYKTAENGQKVPLTIVGPGFAIGEFAMIDRLPRSATARAVSQVRAAKINEETYKNLLSELPDWSLIFIRSLVSRIRHTNEIIRMTVPGEKNVTEEIASKEFEMEANDTFVGLYPDLGSD